MNKSEINIIASKCAEMFIKANLRYIKLENVRSQKQRYLEYYANGEMSEGDYRAKIDSLNRQEAEIEAKFKL